MSLFSKLFSWRVSARGLVKGLSEDEADVDPIRQFRQWFEEAVRAGFYLPESMTLATVTPDGKPSARLVLLKGYDERGFNFYTNYDSRKGDELAANPNACLVFHWNTLHRQVRIEGEVTRLTAEESDQYFQSRPRGSQIAAWASHQSEVLDSREQLEQKEKEFLAQYNGQKVPRPPFWGGYRVAPHRIEFWQGRAHRLHDRLCYIREGEGWRRVRLSP